jgi:hypothetical protein
MHALHHGGALSARLPGMEGQDLQAVDQFLQPPSYGLFQFDASITIQLSVLKSRIEFSMEEQVLVHQALLVCSEPYNTACYIS